MAAQARTLGLTSPFTEGDDVRALQEKLREAGFLLGKADRVLGTETARSFRTGKFWLGYDLAKIEGHGGEIWGPTATRLLNLLLAGKPLPEPYRGRRQARLRQKAKDEKAGKILRERVLGNAKAHTCPARDCKESPPTSNRVPWASIWYGIVGAWCAMGLTRFAADAGSRSFKRGQRYSYVPTIVHDATVGLNGLRRTYRPLPGHGVCFDWQGDGVYDHVEVVDSPPASMEPGTPFTTVGCNTSPEDAGNQSDGGACVTKHRTVLPAGRTVFFSYS